MSDPREKAKRARRATARRSWPVRKVRAGEELRPDPEKHVVLLSVEEHPRDELAERLRERVAETEHREAFVFVHGYDVDFDEAARRTAQIAYDIHHDLVPILFSWPSRGETAAYLADGANVDWAVPHPRWRCPRRSTAIHASETSRAA